jgi:hypothetical protein
MSEMARELGFVNLQQTDIDRFYVPEVHGSQADLNAECQREWLRVLKNTSRFETSQVPPPPIAAASVTPATTIRQLEPPAEADQRPPLPPED